MQDRVKFMSGLGVIVILMAAVGGLTLYQTLQLEKEFYTVENETTDVIISLGIMESNVLFVTLEANEYILDPTQEHLDELREGEKKLLAAVHAYEIAEAGDEPEEVAYFKAGIPKLIGLADEIITLKDSGASMDELLEKSKALDTLMEEYMHELEEEIIRDKIHLDESHNIVKEIIKADYYIFGIIIASIIAGMILLVLFSKSK